MFVDTKREGEVPVIVEEWRNNVFKAADLIDRYGHTKCDLGGFDRGFCIVGALNFVSSGNTFNTGDTTAFGRVDKASRRFGNTSSTAILAFNNAPETTKQDAVNFLRSVASQ